MHAAALFLLTALYTHSVCGSHYHGPLAHPVVLHNGYLADTHEVAAAKSAHLSTLAHQSHEYSHGHADSHGNHGYQKYHGPPAIPHVLHDGHIADTHEVAAAKAEHFAAVATAHTHGGYGHEAYIHGESHEHSHDDQGQLKYHGPTAIPHVLHDSHIADTHEVAAAKAEHFTAIAKARTHGGYGHNSYDHGNRYARHAVPYHGPLAKPIVLHNGYLADTHEVSAAKNAHLSILAHQSHGYSHGHSNSHEDLRYHGPTAIPHVLHDGHIADTHEVAAAKAEHFAAVAKAQAHGGYGHDSQGHGRYSHDSYGYSGYGHGYYGPLAKPVVLHNGYLADTHEVAAARHHHLQALHSRHH